jgi:hypothetical protein
MTEQALSWCTSHNPKKGDRMRPGETSVGNMGALGGSSCKILSKPAALHRALENPADLFDVCELLHEVTESLAEGTTCPLSTIHLNGGSTPAGLWLTTHHQNLMKFVDEGPT